MVRAWCVCDAATAPRCAAGLRRGRRRCAAPPAYGEGGGEARRLSLLLRLAFGCGDDGQLGHGDDENQATPKLIEALQTRVKELEFNKSGTTAATTPEESGDGSGGAESGLGIRCDKIEYSYTDQ